MAQRNKPTQGLATQPVLVSSIDSLKELVYIKIKYNILPVLSFNY